LTASEVNSMQVTNIVWTLDVVKKLKQCCSFVGLTSCVDC